MPGSRAIIGLAVVALVLLAQPQVSFSQDAPQEPQEANEGGEVAAESQIPPPGEPIPLSDESFNRIANEMEITIVNFYADWCRFSQMLKPVFAASARLLSDIPNVRFGSINCEAPDTVESRTKNHINKYPTIKIYRKGVPLKQEYRGQRSPEAIGKYVRELIAEPVISINDDDEMDGHVKKFRRAVIAHYAGDNHESIAKFEEVAHHMRDDCHFLIRKNSPHAGAGGAAVKFKSKSEDLTYDGDVMNEQQLEEWSREHCSPLVREITFENGEELTEEGLPFLIMFHSPDDHDSVKEFTKIMKERFSQERGNINFITADGHKFAHPLRHLGKTKKDLPVLAIDTFKHMYLFRKYSNIYREGKLESFIADLHSGKLHHNYHHPPAEDPDDGPEEIEGPGAPTTTKAASLKEKVDKAQEHIVDHEELKEKAEIHKEPEHDHEDDPNVPDGKPVAVKSVLKHLKPSDNRYSFAHNKDEL